MQFSNLKILLVSFGLLLMIQGKNVLFSNGIVDVYPNQKTASKPSDEGKTASLSGYKAVIKYDNGFVAAGSGGRIDWITVSGKVIKSDKIEPENFNCLLARGNDLIVAGEHGAMFISSEQGAFRKMKSGTDKDINSMVLFKGKIIAGADDGEIVICDEKESFSKINIALKGNIVSVSARPGDCFGVTDQGEIIQTTDGRNWDIFDFNKVYVGFYKPCSFTSILVTEKNLAVAGVYDDGNSVFMTSTLGNVWSDRPLIYKDEKGIQKSLTEQPMAICYDDLHDIYFLACTGGKLMKLPSCSHCNELAKLSTLDLSGISVTNETVMIVGEDFYIKPITY